MQQDFLRRGVAEFIGAFTLTFAGAGAILTLGLLADQAASGGGTLPQPLVGMWGLVGVALAHGLAIAVMVSALGHISGGHFNPAVTFAFALTRRITLPLAGVYVAMQLAGAALAALILNWIYPGALRTAAHLGAPALGGGIDSGRGFAVEAVLTFFLVLVIFATAVDPGGSFKAIAGLAIGLTITLDILMGGPLTGAAMNPSRAFGPMLVGDFWAHGWWIYFTGPLVGAGIAGLVYELLYLSPSRPEPVGPPETGVLEPRPGDAAAS
ncbi:MAG: aquaporin [Gaiellaceae bacterium]|jgi:aquaporin Z|nr:aquaporin [Gaiellaceae bacterium]